jgi:hypothetical protein
MGGYCKFCNNHCFVPVEKGEIFNVALKATCLNGQIFDYDCTLPVLQNSKGEKIGWLQLKRGEEYSIAYQVLNGNVMPYEISNYNLVEKMDLIRGSHYFVAK